MGLCACLRVAAVALPMQADSEGCCLRIMPSGSCLVLPSALPLTPASPALSASSAFPSSLCIASGYHPLVIALMTSLLAQQQQQQPPRTPEEVLNRLDTHSYDTVLPQGVLTELLADRAVEEALLAVYKGFKVILQVWECPCPCAPDAVSLGAGGVSSCYCVRGFSSERPLTSHVTRSEWPRLQYQDSLLSFPRPVSDPLLFLL